MDPARPPSPSIPDPLCGCRPCGCTCGAHSRDGLDRLCDRHAAFVVTRFVGGEVAVLVTLALFLGMIGVWARVLGG